MILNHLKPAQTPAPQTQAVTVVAPVVIPDNPAPSANVERLETIEKLQINSRQGDFVHDNQEMAGKRGFSHVSEAWAKRADDQSDKTVMTYDQALELLESKRGDMRDIQTEYGRFSVSIVDGAVRLIDRQDGRAYGFSPASLDQFAERCGVGSTLPRRLILGDEQDAKTLAMVFENGLRKIAGKGALIRTRDDGGTNGATVRAFLSDQYARIDNRWFLEMLRRIVPGGLVSHFRATDGFDSIYFNLLIPDSVRAEQDSDYGGMLASGNSEIGFRRLKTMPSVFRAICQNGCIWDRVDGVQFVSRVHRGAIELDALEAMIRDNLDRQIPLLSTGIDQMQTLRTIQAPSVSDVALLGAVLQALAIPALTKSAADDIVKHHNRQKLLIGAPSANTAFDVVQGFTGAAQTFAADLQEETERAAGAAMFWSAEKWDTVFRAAKTLKAADLARIFANAV